jgi:acyl dehydratase
LRRAVRCTGGLPNGVLASRREEDDSVSFDIECPRDHRETPDLAHTSWTAGIMSEMCGQFPLSLGVIAFTGTVTTRFQAPVRIGERLVGRATLEGHERRQLFVDAYSHVIGDGDGTREGVGDRDRR